MLNEKMSKLDFRTWNMKQRAMLDYVLGAVCLILFFVLIVLLKTVDVQAVGPEGTVIGLAGMNTAFHDMTGVNQGLYNISKILGILEILLAVFFAGLALYQWIKGKSTKKVSQCLIAAGVFYVITAGLYVLFEKVIINYRPVIMEGDQHVEASFPSTHTLLAIMILGSAFVIAKNLIENAALKRTLRILCFVFMFLTAGARLFSGVHWLTDIIGGIFLGAFLVFEYAGVVKHGIYLKEKN